MEAIREGIQEGIQLVKEQIPPHVFERWHSFQKVLKKKLLLIPRCIKYIFNVTLPISSCIGSLLVALSVSGIWIPLWHLCDWTVEDEFDLIQARYISPIIPQACGFFAFLCAFATVVATWYHVYHRKFPTWDGAGRYINIPTIICLLFWQIVWLLGTIGSRVQLLYDLSLVCVGSNAYISSKCNGVSYCSYILVADVIMCSGTISFWRVVYRFERAKKAGVVADAFIMTSKLDDIDEMLSQITTGVDIDAIGSDGRNALHWACTMNRSTICHILMKKGAKIDLKDSKGWTALHWAARIGNADIVQLLAKYGAEIDPKDMWGTTPLMLSIVGGSKTSASILLELGAHRDAKNVFGQTPLMMCAEEGASRRSIAIVFMNAHTNLEIEDAHGMTALHYAAGSKDQLMLETMIAALESPALLNHVNAFGDTPLGEALLMDNHTNAAILRAAMEGQSLDSEEIQAELEEDDSSEDDQESDASSLESEESEED